MFLYFVLALLLWFALSWPLKDKAVRGRCDGTYLHRTGGFG